MKYPIGEEILGEPSLKVEEKNISDIKKMSCIISGYTGIEEEKLRSFIERFGIDYILSNPSIVCTEEEQEKALAEIKELILGVDKYGAWS